MKIIKDGKPPKAKVFECRGCGCIFEADAHEYTANYTETIVFGEIVDYWCRCPCCGAQTPEKVDENA